MCFHDVIFIVETPVLNANSVDPDQTPRSVASDLGRHYLPMSLLRNARHKWVNIQVNFTHYKNTGTLKFLILSRHS